MAEPSHYELLDLAPGCTPQEVQAAYARVKAQLAPDALATYALIGPEERAEQLRRIELAWAVLGDGEKRKAYDRELGLPSAEEKPVEPASPPPAVRPEASNAMATSAPTAAEPPSPALAPIRAPTVLDPPMPANESSPPPPEVVSPPMEPRSVRPTPVPGAPVDPEVRPVRKTEAELPAEGPVTGEALRRVREALGLTLKDLEQRTKIGHWHFDAIEKERFAALPAPVYLRGFLSSLARELKLDPIRVSRSYLEVVEKGRKS